ncbi:hypothetical protein L3X38_025529 [Prunus dulcis]|uniref:Uncharacterized protein n=1 Tax=Prunus dulcis TaxID=3755 RepID=A0AAD4W2N0_PRUDU|nr:hypothetical protein L3X38_025529 [Prunus dulcis]
MVLYSGGVKVLVKEVVVVVKVEVGEMVDVEEEEVVVVVVEEEEDVVVVAIARGGPTEAQGGAAAPPFARKSFGVAGSCPFGLS